MITRLIVSRRIRKVITAGAWPALGLAQARLKAGALAGKDVSTLTLGALLDTWRMDSRPISCSGSPPPRPKRRCL